MRFRQWPRRRTLLLRFNDIRSGGDVREIEMLQPPEVCEWYMSFDARPSCGNAHRNTLLLQLGKQFRKCVRGDDGVLAREKTLFTCRFARVAIPQVPLLKSGLSDVPEIVRIATGAVLGKSLGRRIHELSPRVAARIQSVISVPTDNVLNSICPCSVADCLQRFDSPSASQRARYLHGKRAITDTLSQECV